MDLDFIKSLSTDSFCNKKNAESFECIICRQMMTDIYELDNCGHLYCKTCIKKINKCAICKKQNIGYHNSLYLQRQFFNMKVICPINNNCKYNPDLYNLYKHVLICDYILVKCDVCNKQVFKKDIVNHKQQNCIDNENTISINNKSLSIRLKFHINNNNINELQKIFNYMKNYRNKITLFFNSGFNNYYFIREKIDKNTILQVQAINQKYIHTGPDIALNIDIMFDYTKNESLSLTCNEFLISRYSQSFAVLKEKTKTGLVSYKHLSLQNNVTNSKMISNNFCKYSFKISLNSIISVLSTRNINNVIISDLHNKNIFKCHYTVFKHLVELCHALQIKLLYIEISHKYLVANTQLYNYSVNLFIDNDL